MAQRKPTSENKQNNNNTTGSRSRTSAAEKTAGGRTSKTGTASRKNQTRQTAGTRSGQSQSGSSRKKQGSSAGSVQKSSGSRTAKNGKSVNTGSKGQYYDFPEYQFDTGRQAASIVVGLLIALVLELSNFDILGKFGGWVKYGQFGLFGRMAYVFPILLLLIFIMSVFQEHRNRMIVCSVILFICLCSFVHLISPLSLEDGKVLSYFSLSADSLSGGGIIGGTLAFVLYTFLSKTGAMIISILGILACLFLLFREPVLELFDYIFYRDTDYDYEEPDEYVDNRKISRRRYPEDEDERYEPGPYADRMKNSRRRKNTVDYDVYDDDGYSDSGRRSANSRAEQSRQSGPEYNDEQYYKTLYKKVLADNKRLTRQKYDEPIYVTEDEEGTIIRIFRTRRKYGRDRDIALVRTRKKAQPLRDGTTDITRSGRKIKGISNELDMMPHNANGDEIHEITRRSSEKKQVVEKPQGRDFFADTLIVPEEKGTEKKSSEQIEVIPERNPKEAAVTSVTQAAVNRRAKEARLVKTRKGESQPVDGETVKKAVRSLSDQRPTQTKAAPVPATLNGTEGVYYAPPMELLARVKPRSKSSEAELEKIADNLELILQQFGVNVTVTDIQAGPSVTRFELQPELGTRVNKITSLADDLKLNLGVTEIRIEAPIPGRQAVGIEIPNKNRQTVYMRELLEEPTLINHPSKIAFAAGKDISGNVVVADIAKMPHLLVAGTTGSGKSVFLNTILMTILYRAKPSEVGLIIVDPKKVEFGVYAGIPHLMKDVVTDPGQAVSTLRWAVNEMTNRYQRMQLSSVRDFKSYNAKVEKGTVSPEEENPRKMNQIVIIIDELADLMMVAKKEAEALICRLAQLARAAGIHLIIATQRPSVDVVTGLIKANVPARVALLVSSQIDSRTIIDMPGAEKLLGNGDMLFYPTGYVKPVRIQGAFVSDDEIQDTVDYLIKNNKFNYFAAESKEIEKFMNSDPSEDASGTSDQNGESGSKYDDCFYEAGKLCIEMGKASSSMLQRRFNLGFNRAARIIDQLEDFGAVGPQNGAKPREILVDTVTFEEMYKAMMESK